MNAYLVAQKDAEWVQEHVVVVDYNNTFIVDAVVADYPFCAFAAFRHQDKGLVAGQSKFTVEPLGIAIPEDALLINWLSNFLNMLEASGQTKILTEKWFQSGSWIKELP